MKKEFSIHKVCIGESVCYACASVKFMGILICPLEEICEIE
jgi:hypothetical protein